MSNKFYISDEAYIFYEIPQPRLKFVYVTNLSLAMYSDSRPDEYKEIDEVRLKNRMFPLWLEPYPRFVRTLGVSDNTIARLALIAINFRITKYQDVKFGMTSFLNQGLLQHASNTLEAIGQGRLTPRKEVEKPRYKPSSLYKKEMNTGYKHVEL